MARTFLVLGAVLAGLAVALAVGLGCRDLVGQIIAGIYVREMFRLGQKVSIDGMQGTIEEIGTVKTVLQNEQGELLYIANRNLLEQQVKVLD